MANYPNIISDDFLSHLNSQSPLQPNNTNCPHSSPCVKTSPGCGYVLNNDEDPGCEHQKMAYTAFNLLKSVSEKIQKRKILDDFCRKMFGNETKNVFFDKQMITSVKRRNRSVFKIANKYQGNYQKLCDICRISVIFNDVNSLYGGLQKLISQCGTQTKGGFGPIVRIKDRFFNPPVPADEAIAYDKDFPAAQYRDVQLLIKMEGQGDIPKGFIVEIQLHHKSMFETKELAVHDFYKDYRGEKLSNPKVRKLIGLSNNMLNNRFFNDIEPKLRNFGYKPEFNAAEKKKYMSRV